MTDAQVLTDFVEAIAKGHSTAGVLGLLAALLTAGVRVLRLAVVQRALAALSPRLAWDAWAKPTRLLVVFGCSAAAAAITAVMSGLPWSSALIAAVLAALGAIGLDQTTSAVGEVAAPVLPPMARRPVGLVFPMPRSPAELAAKQAEVAATTTKPGAA